MSAENYLQQLVEEKNLLDARTFSHAIRLLDNEIHKVRTNNEEEYGDHHPPPPKKTFYEEEFIKLTEKVMLPVEEFPRFNFVGKLLGPKGSTLKKIQSISKTKLSILGKGSTRDREKEQELSKSDDPKNEHFKEPLHVLIQVKAPKSEAHARMANALTEINKCMESDDMIHYEKMDEPPYINDEAPRLAIRGRGMPTPIIRVGIPPPGSIILNGPSPIRPSGHPRMGGRGENRNFRGIQRPY